MPITRFTLFAVLMVLSFRDAQAAQFPDDLFGYRELSRGNVAVFPQWVNALERHLADNLEDGDCNGVRLNTCYMSEWRRFIERIRSLAPREQVRQVNRYANRKSYALDIDQYGIIDYWAIPREFLLGGGDCEDYAITKLLSLRWLGWPDDAMRIVVLQDTNLRIAHAVLALGVRNDILILDNQVEQVLSHKKIVHYAPVYSVTNSNWWMHLPE